MGLAWWGNLLLLVCKHPAARRCSGELRVAFGCVLCCVHCSPPSHPAQVAPHTFSPRGFGCHVLGYVDDSPTTMHILYQGQAFATVDVISPNVGTLLSTRELRSGTSVTGPAIASNTCSEVWSSQSIILLTLFSSLALTTQTVVPARHVASAD